jgi:hypothetical protein
MSTRVARSARFLSQPRTQFIVLAVVWGLGTGLLIWGAYQLRFVLTNIDGFSYIRIAELYHAGDLSEAINGYWSPMVSWSMLPFMALGVNSQLAFMFASAAWSSLGLAAGTWFVWKFSGRNLFAALIMEITTLLLCLGSLHNQTPDLLVVSWVLIFVWALSELDSGLDTGTRAARIRSGALLGAVCAIGYFVKAFIVPVFAVVLVCWLVFRLLAIRKREGHLRGGGYLWMPAAALAVLILVSAPFVTAISVKFGGFTTGSSFQVNTADKLEAGSSNRQTGYTLTLVGPPSKDYTWFNDDRTYQLDLPNQGVSAPAASVHQSFSAKIKYYVNERLMALPFYLEKITAIAPFGALIITLFFLLRAFALLRDRRYTPAMIAAGVFAVYFLGYELLASTNGGSLRYYWPLLPLSTAVAALVWPAVWRKVRLLGGWWRSALVIVLICLIPFAAGLQNGLNRGYPFSTGANSGTLWYLKTAPRKPPTEVLANKLKAENVIPAGSRIVGNEGNQTLQVAFYLRVQYWGRGSHNIKDPRFQQVLRDKHIDFYFLSQPEEEKPLDVSAWGTVIYTYDMPYTCGSVGTTPSAGCRVEVVSVDPTP